MRTEPFSFLPLYLRSSHLFQAPGKRAHCCLYSRYDHHRQTKPQDHHTSRPSKTYSLMTPMVHQRYCTRFEPSLSIPPLPPSSNVESPASKIRAIELAVMSEMWWCRWRRVFLFMEHDRSILRPPASRLVETQVLYARPYRDDPTWIEGAVDVVHVQQGHNEGDKGRGVLEGSV